MTAKAPQPMPEMFKKNGDNDHIPAARPAAPAAPPPKRASAKKPPTFLTLQNIVMEDDTLSDEQKIRMIEKISDLY